MFRINCIYDGRQPVIFLTDIHDDSFLDNFLFLALLLVAFTLLCDVERLAIHRKGNKIIYILWIFVIDHFHWALLTG